MERQRKYFSSYLQLDETLLKQETMNSIVLDFSTKIKLNKGWKLFSEGDLADSIYLVKKGELQLSKQVRSVFSETTQSYDYILESDSQNNSANQSSIKLKQPLTQMEFVVIGQGEILGHEDIFFNKKQRGYTAKSITEAIVFQMKKSQLYKYVSELSFFKISLQNQASCKRKYHDERIQELLASRKPHLNSPSQKSFTPKRNVDSQMILNFSNAISTFSPRFSTASVSSNSQRDINGKDFCDSPISNQKQSYLQNKGSHFRTKSSVDVLQQNSTYQTFNLIPSLQVIEEEQKKNVSQNQSTRSSIFFHARSQLQIASQTIQSMDPSHKLIQNQIASPKNLNTLASLTSDQQFSEFSRQRNQTFTSQSNYSKQLNQQFQSVNSTETNIKWQESKQSLIQIKELQSSETNIKLLEQKQPSIQKKESSQGPFTSANLNVSIELEDSNLIPAMNLGNSQDVSLANFGLDDKLFWFDNNVKAKISKKINFSLKEKDPIYIKKTRETFKGGIENLKYGNGLDKKIDRIIRRKPKLISKIINQEESVAQASQQSKEDIVFPFNSLHNKDIFKINFPKQEFKIDNSKQKKQNLSPQSNKHYISLGKQECNSISPKNKNSLRVFVSHHDSNSVSKCNSMVQTPKQGKSKEVLNISLDKKQNSLFSQSMTQIMISEQNLPKKRQLKKKIQSQSIASFFNQASNINSPLFYNFNYHPDKQKKNNLTNFNDIQNLSTIRLQSANQIPTDFQQVQDFQALEQKTSSNEQSYDKRFQSTLTANSHINEQSHSSSQSQFKFCLKQQFIPIRGESKSQTNFNFEGFSINKIPTRMQFNSIDSPSQKKLSSGCLLAAATSSSRKASLPLFNLPSLS